METMLEKQSSDEITIDLRYYLYLLRFNWLILVVSAVGLAAIAFAVSQFTPPTYRSNTTLLIDTRGNFASADLNTLRASESLAQTYAELLRSRTVLLRVIDELDLNLTVPQLAGRITATPVSSTQLIRIQVESPDRAQAAAIANTLAQVFIEQIREYQSSGYTASQENLQNQLAYLEGQIAQTEIALQTLTQGSAATDVSERNRLETILADYNRDYSALLQSYEEVRLRALDASANIQQTDTALEGTQVRPRPQRNTILAFVFGLLAAVAVVMVREFLDDSVSNPEELKGRHHLPIVGQILHFDQADDDRLITVRAPRSPAAEAFRALRLNLKYVSVDKQLRTLLVTSASPSEGKTTLATNLATILAQSGQSVILIDADWHRPKVHRTFGLSNRAGLSDLFVSELDTLKELAQPTKVEGLKVISSGALPPNPAELLDSDKSRQILESGMRDADMVIVDSPPIFAMTDAAAMSQYVDGVLLVVRAGSTRRSEVAQAVQQLRQVGANLLGFILTDIDDVYRSGRYYYYYRYYYPAYYDNYYSSEGDNSDSEKPRKQKPRRKGRPAEKSRLRQLFTFNRS